ncbi:MAG: nucleoside transporter C-terminal domain-containing protein [Planctomycetota bacterium]
MDDLDRFRGLLGVAAILGAAWVFSENRRAISLRMVAGGLAMQCLLGFVLLRFEAGRRALDAASTWVESVLACSDTGARFLFGDKLVDATGPVGFVFAFRVLPTIVFVAALFAVLYHLGIMQVVVRAFAWVTAKVLGSSGAETLNAAASIFLGQTEAPLVIRPYLARLTRSELAVVMVSGMGLVSGGVLGAYLSAGCSSRDLLTAILMSFPATIYLTKMFIPETGVPETLGTVRVSDERIDGNVLDAAARGTREGMILAANVGAVLISFIALVALVNMGLGWLGGVTGWTELSLQKLLALVFAPFAWLLGVPAQDCEAIGGLLGTRTVLNELIAYFELGTMKDSLSPKAFSLATIAMCSFANISSIGIQLGGIGALIPQRRTELAQLGLKMLVISTLTSGLSAALAGVIMP